MNSFLKNNCFYRHIKREVPTSKSKVKFYHIFKHFSKHLNKIQVFKNVNIILLKMSTSHIEYLLLG